MTVADWRGGSGGGRHCGRDTMGGDGVVVEGKGDLVNCGGCRVRGGDVVVEGLGGSDGCGGDVGEVEE